MAKKLNVALIGYGFMGRAHSNAYRKVNQFFDLEYEPVMKVVCARNQANVTEFAQRWGWAEPETDWRRVVEREDVDLVDICTPNNTHFDIALAAARAGKMIACEKPLALNTAEASEMTDAVEASGLPSMVWFNYRRIPAVELARQVIEEGRLGRIFHYRAKFLQDWTISPDVPQGGHALWRLDVNAAGSGVTGDLLAHSIDQSMWLNGPIESVVAMTETFVRERHLQDDPETIAPVGIEDACAFLARFENGSLATFESTRYARGRKAQATLEINGERGSLYFDLEDLHQLQYFDHGDDSRLRGWRTIQVWDSDHPYMDKWWVPGCGIGYEHTFIHAVADFLRGLETGEKTCPDFRDGLETQVVCDTVLASAADGEWKRVKKP